MNGRANNRFTRLPGNRLQNPRGGSRGDIVGGCLALTPTTEYGEYQ